MTKPVITKRTVKGSALTYNELDTNFQNLRDATINFQDTASNTLSMDLNDVINVEGEVSSNMRVTVSESTNKIIVENIQGDYTREPMGFENRTDSVIAFNLANRVFSITPIGTMRVWIKGIMFSKTAPESITIPNNTGLYLVYYSNGGTLGVGTGFLDWDDQAPVAYVYWNATTQDAPYFADERHGITLDWATHEYLHRTRGTAYANGLAIGNYTTAGDGSLDSHAQIDISNGTIFDEDIDINITHSNSPAGNTWQQDLQGPARIPVFYHSGSTGEWVRDTPNEFPLKFGTNRATYNLNTAGTWTTPDVTNTHHVAYWIVATNNLNYPVMSIMGQRSDNQLRNAITNNTWTSLDLTNLPVTELRPLYRLIFKSATAYANQVSSFLADVTDYRVESILGPGQNVGVESAAFQNVVVGATTIAADSATGTLTLAAGTGISLSADAGTDTVTIASTASGTVNSGDGGRIPFYPSTGTTIDDTLITYTANLDGNTRQLLGDTKFRIGSSTGSAIEFDKGSITSVDIKAFANSTSKVTLQPGQYRPVEFTNGVAHLVGITTTDRGSVSAVNGMIIYNSTDNKFQGYANGTWIDLH
jgi:hypothetical protein